MTSQFQKLSQNLNGLARAKMARRQHKAMLIKEKA
jgi:hypothetical protein